MVVPNFSSKVVPMAFPSKVVPDKLFPGMVVQNYFRIVVPSFPRIVVPSFPRIVVPTDFY